MLFNALASENGNTQMHGSGSTDYEQFQTGEEV